MARIQFRARVSLCACIILASSLSGSSLAQSDKVQVADTPSQRWLPPPKSYPDQALSQAKLLSRLRDLVLKGDESKQENRSILSDAEINSLKEAMKQLGGNLPEGLSSDSLDAIPPDLISKALANPELVRQAKELAREYEQSSSSDPKGNGYQELMDKLLKLNREVEKRKNPSDEITGEPQPDRADPERPRFGEKSKSKELASEKENLEKPSSANMSPSQPGTTQSIAPSSGGLQNTPRDAGNAQSGSTQSGTKPSSSAPSGATPSRSKPNQPNATSSPENRPVPRSAQQERKGPLPAPTQGNSGAIDTQRSQQQRELANQNRFVPPSSSRNAPESGGTGESSSLDIKEELQRRGFGATLQKLVEQAQRSSQSARTNATPPVGNESLPKPAEIARENSSQRPVPTPTNRPANATNQPTPNPIPTRTESEITKGLRKASSYLNNLWTQISKNGQIATQVAAAPPAAPQESAGAEALSLPNPFDARVLQYLLVLVVMGALVFFGLRYRFSSEQERKRILEAQSAPRIDEIQNRDDVVRAFHFLAKQRFQMAQNWWTSGYVTAQFESILPEHRSPIRTLSSLYDQARYFPVEHQLTPDQIETAKLALKQCKG